MFLLVACTSTVEVREPTGMTSYYSEIYHQPLDSDVIEPEAVDSDLPNYTNPRPSNSDLYCVSLGCDSDTKIVSDRRYWYPCSCKKALDIDFRYVECMSDFSDVIEDKMPRHPEC